MHTIITHIITIVIISTFVVCHLYIIIIITVPKSQNTDLQTPNHKSQTYSARRPGERRAGGRAILPKPHMSNHRQPISHYQPLISPNAAPGPLSHIALKTGGALGGGDPKGAKVRGTVIRYGGGGPPGCVWASRPNTTL